MAEQRQAFAKSAVVIKLAIEDDGNVARFVPDRLLAASKIDNAKPAHSECQARSAGITDEKSILIRATMLHGRGHGAHAQLCILAARSKRDTANTAHAIV